jgi:GNAT superfamily N-acetyltransferase
MEVSVSHEILVRRATLADVETVAHHRTAMFLAMGSATPEIVGRLASETLTYLREAMPRGEYIGWLAGLASRPGDIMAGAGVQIRRILPFPQRRVDGGADVAGGRQAVVLNVYTEPAFRRRGLARHLMEDIIAWARQTRLDSLVLHAAPEGRPLYEQMGFAGTNEMRFTGDLAGPGGCSLARPPESA